MGKLVKVTNLKTGRSVIVSVRDVQEIETMIQLKASLIAVTKMLSLNLLGYGNMMVTRIDGYYYAMMNSESFSVEEVDGHEERLKTLIDGYNACSKDRIAAMSFVVSNGVDWYSLKLKVLLEFREEYVYAALKVAGIQADKTIVHHVLVDDATTVAEWIDKVVNENEFAYMTRSGASVMYYQVSAITECSSM